MAVDLEKVDNFHRKKQLIKEILLRTIKNKEIIYGEQAVKIRVPEHLQRHTDDYDVYSRTPKRDAIEAEKELDREFGGDYFDVTPAEHKGTFKVRSRINGKGYADFTYPDKNYGYDEIDGHNYIAFPLKLEEFLEFQRLNPPVEQIAERMDEATKAIAWVLYVTLKKQTPEMEKMSFDEFQKEITEKFIMKMHILAKTVLESDLELLEKKK